MADLEKELVWKLFLRLGKNATETFKMLKVAFGEQTMWRTQVLSDFLSEWYNLSWRSPNTQESIRETRWEEQRNCFSKTEVTTHEVASLVEILFGSIQSILEDNLNKC
jgi:hypothetical protein